MLTSRKFLLAGFLLAALIMPLFSAKADSLGQSRLFFTDKSFDQQNRAQVTASLKIVANNGYFYVEDSWYNNLTSGQKVAVENDLRKLANEFDNVIYPGLTTAYGSEWKPGIDNDNKITILLHDVKKGAAGYFRTQDEVPQIQSTDSNEREMVFLNANGLASNLIKSYLAHEFTHLITYNQKDRLRGVAEEVWLNEARADYTPTILGYNDIYQGSYLEQRVRGFINNSRDPIMEWLNTEGDYGALDIFTHYLVEKYGVAILAESLKTNLVGVDSLNSFLRKYGYNKTFSQIFSDWTLAIYLNDCSLGADYCFTRPELKAIKVAPFFILAPSASLTKLGLVYQEKPWAGYWYRIMGGQGKLDLKLAVQAGVALKVSFVLCSQTGTCWVENLPLDVNNQAEIIFDNFSRDYASLTLIPAILWPLQPPEDFSPVYNLSINLQNYSSQDEAQRIEQLQKQLAELLQKIAQKKALLEKLSGQQALKITCQTSFDRAMALGDKGDNVKCLQTFLAGQGSDIYPAGTVSGFYGSLTQQAVVRFQAKYASEILTPLGLTAPTGRVGLATLAKIRSLYLLK